MLSDHTKERDEYGLPSVRNTRKLGFVDEDYSKEDLERMEIWNTEHQRLFRLVEKARRAFQDINFVQRWLMPHLRLPDYSTAPSLAGAVVDSSNDKTIQEEVDLQTQMVKAADEKRKCLVDASVIFLEHAVSVTREQPLSYTPTEDAHPPPRGFLRVWGPDSHTKYDDQLGFRCSSFARCRPAPNLEELRQREILSIKSLKSHCENSSNPSWWISISGAVPWMLDYVNKKWPPDDPSTNSMRIGLISTTKMKKLNVLFDPSDCLLRSVEGKQYCKENPDGVRFTWSSHYLAYGWIPVQCVVATYNLTQFRAVCRRHNIQPGQCSCGRNSRSNLC